MDIPETSQRWNTPFGTWVRTFGVGRLRRTLECTRQCVYSWVAGRTQPRPDQAQRMVGLSGNRITLEQIYEHQAKALAMSA